MFSDRSLSMERAFESVGREVLAGDGEVALPLFDGGGKMRSDGTA